MNTNELFEALNDPLTGYLDIGGLANLLPDLTNVENFTNGMNKIRLGQGDLLTFAERKEMGMAWISFVGLAAPQKSLVSRNLMAIQDAKTENPAPPQSTS